MKVKTSELTNAALDWAIGTADGEYPPLPGASLWRDETGIRGYGTDPGTGPWYTAAQLHAYVDAARAAKEGDPQ